VSLRSAAARRCASLPKSSWPGTAYWTKVGSVICMEPRAPWMLVAFGLPPLSLAWIASASVEMLCTTPKACSGVAPSGADTSKVSPRGEVNSKVGIYFT
jgi:hypothetical protein